MLTQNDLDNQREIMQDDLMCMLDGLDDEFLTRVCQLVVDRFEILKNKLREPRYDLDV